MSERKLTTFYIDLDLSQALKAVKERDGVPEAEQIRRAVREWFEKRGALKAAPRRVGARRKA